MESMNYRFPRVSGELLSWRNDCLTVIAEGTLIPDMISPDSNGKCAMHSSRLSWPRVVIDQLIGGNRRFDMKMEYKRNIGR